MRRKSRRYRRKKRGGGRRTKRFRKRKSRQRGGGGPGKAAHFTPSTTPCVAIIRGEREPFGSRDEKLKALLSAFFSFLDKDGCVADVHEYAKHFFCQHPFIFGRSPEVAADLVDDVVRRAHGAVGAAAQVLEAAVPRGHLEDGPVDNLRHSRRLSPKDRAELAASALWNDPLSQTDDDVLAALRAASLRRTATRRKILEADGHGILALWRPPPGQRARRGPLRRTATRRNILEADGSGTVVLRRREGRSRVAGPPAGQRTRREPRSRVAGQRARRGPLSRVTKPQAPRRARGPADIAAPREYSVTPPLHRHRKRNSLNALMTLKRKNKKNKKKKKKKDKNG